MKYTYTGKDMASGGESAPKAAPAVVVRRRGGGGAVIAVVVLLAAAAAAAWWWLDRSKADSPLAQVTDNGGGVPQMADKTETPKASDKDLVLYLESTAGEAKQLFEYVRQSALVQDNRQYAALMADVGFVFDATNDEVNAVACRKVDAEGKESRWITCYAGQMRYGKVVALAAAAEMGGNKGAVKAMMDAMTPMQCMRLDLNEAAALLRKCNLDRFLFDEAVLSRAKSIGAGEVLGVFAHEVGHQVLGHNYQDGKDFLNNSVRKDYESQADLFAAAVMSSSPFGEYVFAGRVFALWVRMRQTEQIIAKIPERELDHPLDRDRFVALVTANKEKAAALGIELPQ